MQKLELSDFRDLRLKGCIIIDTRLPEMFVEGFIEGSFSVPFDDKFIPSLHEVVDDEQEIILVTNENDMKAIDNVIRVSGLGNVRGYLDGGYSAWVNDGGKYDMLMAIEADEFNMDYQFDEFYLIDIREKEEFAKEHVEDAENIPLGDLENLIGELETMDSYYVYGNNTGQAVTAASILKRFGFHRLRVVTSGFEQIKASGIPIFVQKKKEKSLPK